jgi:uncharacterized protein (TIGR00266 family)
MKYEFQHGPVFTTLTLKMNAGDQFRAEAGAMLGMSPTIELQAKAMGKGFLGTLAAAAGGDGLFGSVFTARAAGEVILAPALPGDITQLALKGETVLAHGHSYLAGAMDLTLSAQGSLKSMFSGGGLFLNKISGTGDLFLTCVGAVFTRTLAAGEVFIIDSGHVVAFQETATYKVRKAAPGLFNTLASGEGLVVEFTGPGQIWGQTRNLRPLASALAPYLASR